MESELEAKVAGVERDSQIRDNSHNPLVHSLAFLDRGILDNVAYCREGNVRAPPVLLELEHRTLYSGVFILEMLPDYQTDGIRRESRVRAEKIQELISQVYRKAGYQPVKVPVLSNPAQRADFVLKSVSNEVIKRGD